MASQIDCKIDRNQKSSQQICGNQSMLKKRTDVVEEECTEDEISQLKPKEVNN